MVSKKKQTKKASSKNKANKKTSLGVHIEFKGLLTLLILHELSLRELAGEDLAKKIGKRKGSTLTPGTIYPALKKLKVNKLVSFEKQGRRKVYSLTKKGKEELEVTYSLFSRYFYGLKNKIKRVKKTNKDLPKLSPESPAKVSSKSSSKLLSKSLSKSTNISPTNIEKPSMKVRVKTSSKKGSSKKTSSNVSSVKKS